ncbi:ABC transporter permease [Manganibacter manganicus]|jgi:peptide/nickel transport system permease protein|uniref:Peptide ABC transporter permease n=1 Tax=Manganibacter manganicus TaxID=1873176 RepID=A0A1V8RVT4_9HYPH|nr:ABC transporter permease [Pseudaminobacter manganicus]OQM77306.1 peptide ABC transporter permease [Pseudaminobacter manganicus]
MQLDFLSPTQVVIHILFYRLWPVWVAMAVLMGLSFRYRKRLGLYGQLYDSGVGISGIALLSFWFFAAVFSSYVSPFDPLDQIAVMRNALPGAIEPQSGLPFLLGGDKLARDVFSRVIDGSRIVLLIAPLATLVALTVGITLGLPAGYFGKKTDSTLSFLANLVLAFPVILLFYLLVSPEIVETGLPRQTAGVFFAFPVILACMAFGTRYAGRPLLLAIQLLVVLAVTYWLYSTFVFFDDPFGQIQVTASTLNIFVAVVFASSPGVFRIVRGLVMDIKTRDYVAAAQTRGENPWYIMVWEVLPNARGPLIVDACLRIGYTTILLGTLGFFGLGMPPESPDWGTTIKDGSQLLRAYVHPALPPAIALMSFVLGLNLLADALREESMKD